MPPTPKAPTPKRRVHQVEPELQQPLPRRVRATRFLQVMRWFTLAAFMAAGILLLVGVIHFGHPGSDPNGRYRVPSNAGLLILLVLPLVLWLVLEPMYWSARPLSRTGATTVAVMLAPPGFGVGDALELLSKLAARRGGGSSKRVKYRYRVAANEWRETTKRVQSTDAGSWAEEGSTVTVLYDPANPARHALYPVIRQRAVVLPPLGPAASQRSGHSPAPPG